MKTLSYQGIEFHSLLEIEFWKKLTKMFRRTQLKLEYEADKIPYTVVNHRNYIPDFKIQFPDGHVRYLEIKGYLRTEDRVKMKLVKDQHPGLDIRIVFAKDNKLSSKSNTRYSTWAKKTGIPYAIATIPNEWKNRNG